MTFQEVLIQRMQEEQLSVQQLSELTDINVFALLTYVNGKLPHKKHLDKICEALGIDRGLIGYNQYNMTIDEARQLMQCSPEFIKQAIRKGRLPGCYVEGGKRDTFHIPRKAFMKYLTEVKDISNNEKQIKELSDTILELGNKLDMLICLIQRNVKKDR